jgi:hypothetical protein
VVVASALAEAERWLADLDVLIGNDAAALYPPREGFGEVEPHAEVAGERVETLERLLRSDVRLLLTTARAVQERTHMPRALVASRLELRKGDVRRLEELASHLELIGFTRVPMVDDVAQFSVRGGIVDIYGFGMTDPVRLEFWGDEITDLRHFDLSTQRSVREASLALILPAEATPSAASGVERRSLADLWPPDTLVVLPDESHLPPEWRRTWDEAAHHVELARRRGEDAPDREGLLQSPEEVTAAINRFARLVVADPSAEKDAQLFPVREPESIARDVKRLRRVVRDGTPTIILCDNPGQAERPFNAPIIPFSGINARNFVKTNRLSGYLQYGRQAKWLKHDIYYNAGIRAQRWSVGGDGINKAAHIIFSPRVQFAIKPFGDEDILFRAAAGMYQQPPFYRELRDERGIIQPDVKAQKSFHFVVGNEYSLTLWGRPFTLLSEAYYKILSNINPYTLEDVRIRYAARNTARAYAYGFDLRINGAFVPGTESWVSLGYLKTEENIEERGYISRPTDQRLKVGILFQDYIPTIPSLRMYLNLVYNTGLPGGSPNYADPYIFQNRLRDYKRADLGISYIFADINKKYPKNHWLYRFKELNFGFEIFNLFNNQNSITNTWVRDVESKQQFAVPNFMTTRVLNLKLRMRF